MLCSGHSRWMGILELIGQGRRQIHSRLRCAAHDSAATDYRAIEGAGSRSSSLQVGYPMTRQKPESSICNDMYNWTVLRMATVLQTSSEAALAGSNSAGCFGRSV